MKQLGRCNDEYLGRVQSDTIAVVKLDGSSESHFNAPTGSSIAIFASTGNFFCLVNGQTAAVAGSTDTSFPSPNTIAELNPALLAVVAGTKISLIASAVCTVTISFYSDSTATGTTNPNSNNPP